LRRILIALTERHCPRRLIVTPFSRDDSDTGAPEALGRKELMEHAIKRLMLRFRSRRASRSSILVHSHGTALEHTWRIYSFGDLDLKKVLEGLPELFHSKECRTIKSGKKIRVFRSPLHIGRAVKLVYIKQYNALYFRHRLASIFYDSPALRALFGAAILLREGYATARPIAAVEHRYRGLLINSFYLSEEIAGAKTVRDYWRESLHSLTGIEGFLKRRAVLRALAQLFRSLHERHIYHNDLKASNILARDSGPTIDGVFNLIDLQGVRKCGYLSHRRRIKNLAQLNRTLGNDLSRTEKLSFIRAYVDDRISDRRKTRRVVEKILKETARQRLRHPIDESDLNHKGTSRANEIDSIEHGISIDAERFFYDAKRIAPLIAASMIGAGL
jgi:tRNA A-37 threonylcarbamoyl transferase component Bud32